MAVKVSDYVNIKNESNLKTHKKDKRKFLFDFRIDEKRYRKTYTLSATDWSKKEFSRVGNKQITKIVDANIENIWKVPQNTL